MDVHIKVNKWAAAGPSTASMRKVNNNDQVAMSTTSLRKVNNSDQVAIAIDTEPGSTSGRLEDEDDDKGNPALLNLLPFHFALLSCIIHETHYLRILIFFLCSSWLQVAHYIKNSPKIYKTRNRHDRWPMVRHFLFFIYFFLNFEAHPHARSWLKFILHLQSFRVSCDRALMRQPTLRLSIIVYWAVLHTLLASFVF